MLSFQDEILKQFGQGVTDIEGERSRKKQKITAIPDTVSEGKPPETKSTDWMVRSFASGTEEIERSRIKETPLVPALGRAAATIPFHIGRAGAGLVQKGAERWEGKREEVRTALDVVRGIERPKPEKKHEPLTADAGFGTFLLDLMGKGVERVGAGVEAISETGAAKGYKKFRAESRLAKAMVGGELSPEVEKFVRAGDLERASEMLKDEKGFAWTTGAEKLIAKPVARAAARGGEALGKITEKIRPITRRGSYKYFVTSAIEGVGSTMGPAVVATLATKNPGVGMAVMFPQVFGETYSEERGKGTSVIDSTNKGLFYAASEILSEGIPLGILTKPGGKLTKRVVTSATAEGIQESINEATQIAYDAGIVNEYTPIHEIGKRLLEAGIIGAIGGGGMAVGTHAFTGDEGKATDKLGKDILDSVTEVYKKGEQTPDQAIASIVEGYKGGLFEEADLNELSKKFPELKDGIRAGQETAKKELVKEQLSLAIDEGLTAGEFQGEEFTDADAMNFIENGMANDIFDTEDIESFKEKHPSLKHKLNELIADDVTADMGLEDLIEEPTLLRESEKLVDEYADIEETYAKAKERVRKEPTTLHELQEQFRKRQGREATERENAELERVYEKAKRRSQKRRILEEKKKAKEAPAKSQEELEYEAYAGPKLPAEVRLRKGEVTYPRGAKYVAGKAAPEDLAVEHKIALSTNNAPWKTKARAENALKHGKRFKAAGFTSETHEIVPVDGGFGIAKKPEVKPEIPKIEKKEPVPTGTFTQQLDAMPVGKEVKIPALPDAPSMEGTWTKFKDMDGEILWKNSRTGALRSSADMEIAREHFGIPKEIEKPKAPKKIAEGKQLHEIKLLDIHKDADVLMSEDMRDLHDHKARVKGFEKAGGSFVEGYIKKLAEIAEKTNPDLAMTAYNVLTLYKDGKITEASLEAEKVLGELHKTEKESFTPDKIAEVHKQAVKDALAEGKTVSKEILEGYPDLVEKPKKVEPEKDIKNKIKEIDEAGYYIRLQPKGRSLPEKSTTSADNEIEGIFIFGNLEEAMIASEGWVEDLKNYEAVIIEADHGNVFDPGDYEGVAVKKSDAREVDRLPYNKLKKIFDKYDDSTDKIIDSIEPEKEPWEMPQKEWVDGQIKSPALHGEHVKRAVAEGKDVPEEVLREYPDLVAKSERKLPPTVDDAKIAEDATVTPKPIETKYRKRLKELKAEMGEEAYFEESLGALYEKEPQEILNAYRKLHPEGAGVLYQAEGSLGATISPSAKEPGRWQTTWFDAKGFSGDTSHATEAEAFAEAYRDGYRLPNPERGKQQMTSVEFVEGILRLEAQRKKWAEVGKKEPWEMTLAEVHKVRDSLIPQIQKAEEKLEKLKRRPVSKDPTISMKHIEQVNAQSELLEDLNKKKEKHLLAPTSHKQAIMKAQGEGKEIPSHVLAEYDELAVKPKVTEIPESILPKALKDISVGRYAAYSYGKTALRKSQEIIKKLGGDIVGAEFTGSFIKKHLAGKTPKDIDIVIRVKDISKIENVQIEKPTVLDMELDIIVTDGKRTLVSELINPQEVKFVEQMLKVKPEAVVTRALKDNVVDIGQLSEAEIRALNKAVKSGVLEKAKAGKFPVRKNVYAKPGFDFEGQRREALEELKKPIPKKERRKDVVLRKKIDELSSEEKEFTIAELRRMNEKQRERIVKLRDIAHRDPLTGLLNRRGLKKKTGRKKPHHVFMDLIGFKNINDTVSHEAGDTVLKAIARGMKAVDVKNATRWGGDELVFQADSVEMGEAKAQELRDYFKENPIKVANEKGEKYRVTVMFRHGVARTVAEADTLAEEKKAAEPKEWKRGEKYPGLEKIGAARKIEKPAEGRGERSNKEGVEFYNPFRPRTRNKVVEGAEGVGSFGGRVQAYADGFFTQGHYAVKLPKEPEVKKDIITGKDAPDIKATFPDEKDLAPAYILGEYKPSRAGCTFVHAMTAGQQDTFFNADYVDVILTKYPNAKLRTTPSEHGGSYGVFEVDGETVGLVMSTQLLDVSETLEEINRIKEIGKEDAWDITKKERRWILDNKTGKVLKEATGTIDKVDLLVPLDREIIDIHTHPDEAMPSDYDWGRLGWSNVKEMRVVTPSGTVYELSKPAKFKKTPRELRERHNAIENEIFDSGRSRDMSVDEILEAINEQLAEETGIIIKKKTLEDYRGEPWLPEIKPAKEPAKGDILFAEKGGLADARHTVESLKTELSERIGGDALDALDRGKKVRLITADEAVKLTGRPDLRESGIQGFYSNGIVYLLPENIDRGHGFNVLMHELGVHHGYNKIFGEKLAKEVFNAFALKRYGDDKLGKAIAKAFDRVPESTPVHFRSEEAVAYFCEEHANIDLAIHRKIITRMRLWAVKHLGVKPDIFTHDDYVALAASAVRGEAKKAAREPVREEVSREIFYSEINKFSVPEMPVKKAAEKVTDNPNFVKWFGDSKVVDEKGEPLVVYHGSGADFTVFDKDQTLQGVFWFTSDKKGIERGEVGALRSGKIMPVYLSAKNLAGWEEYNKLTLYEIGKSFDGIKLDSNYVIFKPTQIKSIFNVGTFDPTKADIRYSAKEKKDLHAWADNLIESAKDHGVVLDREPPTPERLRETSMSILSGLDASKLGGSARSFLKGLDPRGKGYGAAIEKWLASPEWYQHPVLKKIVGRSLDKSEKFHNTFNEFNAVDDPVAEHDTVAKTLEALARKGGISKAASILGKTSSDFKKLEALMDDADVYGEKHTVEELKKKGYSEDTIQAWSVIRESYDKQLDALIKPMKDLVARIKEQAAFMGKDPVYPDFGDFIIEGKKKRLTLEQAVMEMGRYRGTYSPRIRERGAWVVTGKIEKSIAEGGTEYFRNNRKSKSFANLLRDDLKRQGYTDIKVEKEDRLPEETFQAIRMAEMGTMIGHAASKGLDKYDGEMQMAFMDEIVTASADMIKSRGARATMIRRREGMAVKGYVTDPLIRFVRYTGTNAAGIAKAEMAEKMIKDLYGVYVDGKKVGGIDAAKEGEVHSLARAYIEEQLRNTEAGDRAVGILKGLTTLKFLGFNPRSILVNLSSLTTSVPMSLHTYAMDGKGSLLRIGKFLSIGCKDYTKVMGGKQLPNTDEATFIDNFRNSGYTDAQYTRDATGMVQGAYGTAWSKLMGGSMWAFGKSEEWVRGGTALAAYRLCKKQGLSHINAEKKAINATAKAHGTYGKETLPMVAWGKGVGRLGQAFYTYLKFPHNYMQMLYDAGIRKKNIKGVIFGMAAPAVLGGIVAVPMFSATMAIVNAMLSSIGDDRDAEKFVYDTLNEYLGETGEEAVRGGLLGLLDVDISGSLSMGPGAIPTSLFELTGAVGGMAQDIYRGGKFAVEGEYGRAFEKLVPKAVGNIALAIREIREGATTGRGDRVWDEEGRPYMPTPSETAKRALGFRSARRALLAQSTWVTKREERRFKETRSDIYRKIKYLTADAENVRIDKETSDKISRYNKNALKTSNVTLISPASVEYQIAKMDTPTSKQKARVTQSERAATFEGDIWAGALGITDEPDMVQLEIKRLSDLGILKYSAPPSRNINAGHGIEVKLNDDQYSRYVADTSAMIKLAMDRLVARSEWQKWSDKKRAFAVKRVINKGRKIVRDRLKKTILKARLKRR